MKQKWIKSIKSETGSGLVLSLMVLLVLSVLGASLGVITIGSYQLADTNQDSNSAYYIAEAGANMAYEELKSGVEEAYVVSDTAHIFYNTTTGFNSVIDKVNGKTYASEVFSSQNGDQSPTAMIEIEGPKDTEDEHAKTYDIVSTGEVNGKERSVEKEIEVSWVPKPESEPSIYIPKDATVIAKSGIEIKQSSNPIIKGDMHLEATGPPGIHISNNNFNYEGGVYLNPDFYDGGNINPITQGGRAKDLNFNRREYALPWASYERLADFDQYNGIFNKNIDQSKDKISFESDNSIFEIEEDLSIDELYFRKNTLIDTKGAERNIVVDSLYFEWGGFSVTLTEDSRLNIYVKNSFKINGGSIRVNPDNSHQNLKIFYNGRDTFETGDNSSFLGASVYVNNANISVQNFNGVIITDGKEVNINNSSRLYGTIIAPHANINIQQYVVFKGQLIADSFIFKNSDGTKINYTHDYTDGLLSSGPRDSWSENDLDVDDLISTQPAIEP